jgi:hypothetical protein
MYYCIWMIESLCVYAVYIVEARVSTARHYVPPV